LTRLPEPEEPGESVPQRSAPVSSLSLWLFITIAVLYAFAEGTFSNWAVIYLHEFKNLSESAGALALSLFWAFLAAGRLLVSVLVVFIPAVRIWQVLPLFMAAIFILLPHADSALLGVGLFAIAGLSCSAFFPLTVRLVSQCFPSHVAWVSSMITAALMIGIGSGTFVIGVLTGKFPLEEVYTMSAAYPLSVFFLAVVFSRRYIVNADMRRA
jgi:predicted MFS family arabinose efflux permease